MTTNLVTKKIEINPSIHPNAKQHFRTSIMKYDNTAPLYETVCNQEEEGWGASSFKVFSFLLTPVDDDRFDFDSYSVEYYRKTAWYSICNTGA